MAVGERVALPQYCSGSFTICEAPANQKTGRREGPARGQRVWKKLPRYKPAFQAVTVMAAPRTGTYPIDTGRYESKLWE